MIKKVILIFLILTLFGVCQAKDSSDYYQKLNNMSWNRLDSLVEACHYFNMMTKKKAKNAKLVEAYLLILEKSQNWAQNISGGLHFDDNGKSYIDPTKVIDLEVDPKLEKKYKNIVAYLKSRGNFHKTFLPIRKKLKKYLKTEKLKEKFGNPKIVAKYYKKLAANGLWIRIEENKEVLRIHPYFISSLTYVIKPNSIKQFESLMRYFNYDEALRAKNLRLNVYEIESRILACEEFYRANKKSPFLVQINEKIVKYLKLWVAGKTQNYDPFIIDKKSDYYSVNKSSISSIEKFVKRYPQSYSYELLAKALEILEHAKKENLTHSRVEGLRNQLKSLMNDFRFENNGNQ